MMTWPYVYVDEQMNEQYSIIQYCSIVVADVFTNFFSTIGIVCQAVNISKYLINHQERFSICTVEVIVIVLYTYNMYVF